MSLALPQQFEEMLKRCNRPVIVLSATASIDDFASAFAVRSFLKKINKPCEIVTKGGVAPSALKFLSTFSEVKSDLVNIRSLSLRVNIDHAKLEALSYAVEGRELVITVTPKTGAWRNNDVRVICNDYSFDVIVVIGAPDKASFGGLELTYADFFLRTPMIVIDCSPANEQFGSINIVDVTATSVSEVCFDLLSSIDPALIDEAMGTALLAGMMSKTKSFRANNVSPKTLGAAQKLIEKGAKREQVVEHLYRTRSVQTLRLWGRALARLKSNEAIGLVWTLVTRQDFITAGVSHEALRDIVDELLSTSPSAKVAIVLFENVDGKISARVHASAPHNALILASSFTPVGTREVAMISFDEKDIVKAEEKIVNEVKRKISHDIMVS